MEIKQNRFAAERQRDMAETRRMQEHQSAMGAAMDHQAAMKRQRAMQIAAENQQLAELKRRNEIAARVRVDMKEETDITRAKYRIQSGIIR